MPNFLKLCEFAIFETDYFLLKIKKFAVRESELPTKLAIG